MSKPFIGSSSSFGFIWNQSEETDQNYRTYLLEEADQATLKMYAENIVTICLRLNIAEPNGKTLLSEHNNVVLVTCQYTDPLGSGYNYNLNFTLGTGVINSFDQHETEVFHTHPRQTFFPPADFIQNVKETASDFIETIDPLLLKKLTLSYITYSNYNGIDCLNIHFVRYEQEILLSNYQVDIYLDFDLNLCSYRKSIWEPIIFETIPFDTASPQVYNAFISNFKPQLGYQIDSNSQSSLAELAYLKLGEKISYLSVSQMAKYTGEGQAKAETPFSIILHDNIHILSLWHSQQDLTNLSVDGLSFHDPDSFWQEHITTFNFLSDGNQELLAQLYTIDRKGDILVHLFQEKSYYLYNYSLGLPLYYVTLPKPTDNEEINELLNAMRYMEDFESAKIASEKLSDFLGVLNDLEHSKEQIAEIRDKTQVYLQKLFPDHYHQLMPIHLSKKQVHDFQMNYVNNTFLGVLGIEDAKSLAIVAWQRFINNVPVWGDGLVLIFDPQTERIVSFSSNLTNLKLSTEDMKDRHITSEEAAKIMLNHSGLELVYKHQPQSNRAELYWYSPHFDKLVISAFDGMILNPDVLRSKHTIESYLGEFEDDPLYDYLYLLCCRLILPLEKDPLNKQAKLQQQQLLGILYSLWDNIISDNEYQQVDYYQWVLSNKYLLPEDINPQRIVTKGEALVLLIRSYAKYSQITPLSHYSSLTPALKLIEAYGLDYILQWDLNSPITILQFLNLYKDFSLSHFSAYSKPEQ